MSIPANLVITLASPFLSCHTLSISASNFVHLLFRIPCYTGFLLLHTLPVLYEKYEDQVDAFAEKAMIEIKKQYAVLDEKVLSKIPRGPFKDKKLA